MDDARHLVAGAYRHRRFGDDHREPGDGGGDLARSGIDVGKIRMPVAAARRGPDRDEKRRPPSLPILPDRL
jgi:hypothetical protein